MITSNNRNFAFSWSLSPDKIRIHYALRNTPTVLEYIPAVLEHILTALKYFLIIVKYVLIAVEYSSEFLGTALEELEDVFRIIEPIRSLLLS